MTDPHATPDRPGRRLPNPITLGVIAALVLALASFGGGATRNRGGALEALGLEFVAFGHGRNVSILAFWIGIFLLVAAWVIAGKTVIEPTLLGPSRSGDEHAYVRMRRALWVWIAPLLAAGPLASRDVYSYLMQGAMVRDGFDPYTQGAAANPGPYLLEVSHDWRNTTTPYGPLHLWTGDIITSLVGDNVALGIIAYKIVSVLGFAAIAWSIPRIARRLGGNPALALWLGVANPVMILHLVGGMHNESVMVGLVSLGVLAALRGSLLDFVLGVALIALAVSLKVTAFFAMPFVLWLFVHRFAGCTSPHPARARTVGMFLAGGVLILIETIAVIYAVTLASGSSWGWLHEITGNSKVINPLAGPTLATDIVTPVLQIFIPDLAYNSVLAVFRTIGMGLMLVGLVIVWWLSRGGNRHAIMGMVAAYQVAFLFNSVTLPWYYASVISLLGTASPPRWLLKLGTGASLIVAVSFAGDGNHQLYNWWWVIAAFIGAWACVEWLFGALPKATPLRLSAAPEAKE